MIGTQLGHYRITAQLGAGGKGVVFLDTNNDLMSVAVTRVGDGSLRFGTPRVLFSTRAFAIRNSFNLAADGRILVNHFGEEQSEPLKLVENWTAQLSD